MNVRVPPTSVIEPVQIVLTTAPPPLPNVVSAVTFTTLWIVHVLLEYGRIWPPASVTVPVPKTPLLGLLGVPTPPPRRTRFALGPTMAPPEYVYVLARPICPELELKESAPAPEMTPVISFSAVP